MQPSKAQRIRDLERELKDQATRHEQAINRLREEARVEQLRRVAAQRGLAPYVTAVQALNAWLGDRPDLLDQLTPILGELGLLGVRVGYDPDRDLALSVISAHRH